MAGPKMTEAEWEQMKRDRERKWREDQDREWRRYRGDEPRPNEWSDPNDRFPQ